MPSESGALICEERLSRDVPSWGFYVLSVVAFLICIPFLIESIPMLQGRPARALNGGVFMPVLGIVFFIAAIVAFIAPRFVKQSTPVRFFTTGLEVGDQFCHYRDLHSISVEIVEPTGAEKTIAAAQGALSLFTGNWARVGMAMGASKSRGSVSFIINESDSRFCNSLSLSDLETIAHCAGNERNEVILMHA